MSLLKLPGLIDIHVHLRTPGQEYKEDFSTGTQAALAGGFTTVVDMPNNKIPITTKTRLEEKIEIAKKEIYCDLGFYFGSLGDNLDEFEKVKDKVLGLKLYLNETTGNFLIDKTKLEEIVVAWHKSNSDKPILLHAEDDAVGYVIELVRKIGQKVHFCHISTRQDLEQIMKAKEDNLPVTCGVTPHHLFLTEQDTKTLGPFGKMKPYLKTQKDVDFLWNNLNRIDAIESDHAPHTIEEKRGEVPPFGVPGLETTLPLLLTAVHNKRLQIEDITRLCFENPKKILDLKIDEKTYIEVDPDEQYEIKNENLFTKCKWTPFDGWKVVGKVKKVVLHGQIAFETNRVLASPGSGKILL